MLIDDLEVWVRLSECKSPRSLERSVFESFGYFADSCVFVGSEIAWSEYSSHSSPESMLDIEKEFAYLAVFTLAF